MKSGSQGDRLFAGRQSLPFRFLPESGREVHAVEPADAT